MKHRQPFATCAAGVALVAPALPATHGELSFASAMEIARNEILRCGLAETHHVAALYAGVDRHEADAAFAVIVCPHTGARPRLKPFIHEDGRTTLQPIHAGRSARAA